MPKANKNKKIKKQTDQPVSYTMPDPAVVFVVGIGASAGGLESLKLFFDHVPSDSGMAFVIVQHLDPTHKSMLPELIAGHTKMTVNEVSNGVTIKPDAVYVIPADKGLKIFQHRLFLMELPIERAKRRPIDTFFCSLAEEQKENAIGIVLSGTGTEGTLGLKEIKAAGGICIVQEPRSAQFDGMPRSAIAASLADYVLPPEKMPEQLLDYIQSKRNGNTLMKAKTPNLPENMLSKVFQVIRTRTGYDFSNYKLNTISRRITKRMALNRLETIEDYARFLQDHSEEVTRLCDDFLIGVTSFFRDPEVFKNLEKKGIPYLLEKCGDRQDFRAWVCGCSTGEEAYSLAILLKEALEKNKRHLKVTIFATDLDIKAIEFARNAIYDEGAIAHVSPPRLSRFFTKGEHGYQLKKEIREMVVFAQHNLLSDPPFSKLELISCRNLLIYLKAELQKKIIPVFHYSLNNEGLLLLGTSESIGEHNDLFTPMDAKHKLFKKKDTTIKKPYSLAELPFVERKLKANTPEQLSIAPKITTMAGMTEKPFVQPARPASVVIDKNNEALYFSGNTGIYLSLPDGIARWNILEIAKEGLRSDLAIAIQKARKNKTAVKKENVEIPDINGLQAVTINIKPLLTKEYDSGTLMILFEPAESPKIRPEQDANSPDKQKAKNSDLEKELKSTRVDLRAAVKDLETSNEDLQSANEELQSTNEELETSREELQSLNEELITVNAELNNKIDQLSQANNDLNNLLRSIEVATLFLDRSLKIKRYTPAATKIFNLIPSDIDRPITQLSINLKYKTLADDVTHALKTLEAKKMEVCAMDGTWYYMRIIPYRTTENIIEGVLVTLVDISGQKKVEQALARTNEHLNLAMENLPAVPYTFKIDPELEIDFVGESAEKVTGFLPERFVGKFSFWMGRVHPDDKRKTLNAYSKIAKKGNDDQVIRWKCADGRYKKFFNYIRYVIGETGKPPYIAGVWQEVLEPGTPKGKNKHK